MALADAPASSEPDSGGIRGEEKVAAKPLLSAPSPSSATAAPAQESLEELDRRYAPYARRDAYGPMGLGPVGAAEAARLALAAAVLLPLRVVAGVLVVVAYYLVCRVCTLRVEEEREGGEGEGEGYARLEGWRREVAVRCGRSLARAMMFVFGFYWIREYDCRLPDAELSPPDSLRFPFLYAAASPPLPHQADASPPLPQCRRPREEEGAASPPLPQRRRQREEDAAASSRRPRRQPSIPQRRRPREEDAAASPGPLPPPDDPDAGPSSSDDPDAASSQRPRRRLPQEDTKL